MDVDTLHVVYLAAHVRFKDNRAVHNRPGADPFQPDAADTRRRQSRQGEAAFQYQNLA